MNSLNKYKIEYKISTLARCAIMKEKAKPASFKINDTIEIEFSHYNFSYRKGWEGEAWIASSEIEAKNYHKAFDLFYQKLSHIMLRIPFISQSYTNINESFLIHKLKDPKVFFRYIKSAKGVGLMFMEKEKRALEELLKNNVIPNEFFFYWRDVVNTIGYSAKLLLMFSAIEALAKSLAKNKNKKDKYNIIEKILGKKLKKAIYNSNNKGLRHRLVHGEYFNNPQDSSKNYVDLIHNKILKYFNNNFFSEPFLHKITRPQRNPFGNKKELKLFFKRKDNKKYFILKELLEDFNKNGYENLKNYEYIPSKNIENYY